MLKQAHERSHHRSSRDHPAFPHAMVLTAYFVLSPVSEFVLSPSSESVRRLQAGIQSFLSMRRIDARRKNAKAFRFRHSQSFAKRRQRLSQAMVRSTIQRLGKTAKPFAVSERLTISASICRRILRTAD